MVVKIYGHFGQPFIVFPSSRGRYFDYEGMGMVAAIAPFIDDGRIKLFCVDSIDAHSWYDFSVPPAERNSATSNMTSTSLRKWSQSCAATATMTT